MSASSLPREDSQRRQRADVSPLGTPNISPATAQPRQQKHGNPNVMITSPPLNCSTTPRLLFTWDPYRNVSSSPGVTGGTTTKPPDEEAVEEGRLASSIGGCSTTSSVNNNNNNNNTTTGAETSTLITSANRSVNHTGMMSAAVVCGALPPMTISSLLSGSGYTNRGSPQLSIASAPMQQQMLHKSPLSAPSAAPGSAHSTPSGSVLKRIPTSAKDGRQYFLDYSPNPNGSSGAAGPTTGGMPNLMLPPNTSPAITHTSPPPPESFRPQQQPPVGMEAHDLDGNSSNSISPQAIPLVSPPRSSSSNPGAYSSYGAVAATSSHSVLPGTPQLPMSSITQHNPYRTPSAFYTTSYNASPATQQQPQQKQQKQPQQQHALHHQGIDEADIDPVYILESDPSVFITRMLPPPPPLPELARVLTVPGVVQSLCARWCTHVAAVLKSAAFAAITASPPPPPSSVTMSREGTSGSTKEELTAWYETAVNWWERLDQEGTGAVDIRAKSRAVAAAVELVASGRSRRLTSHNTNSSANGGRYNPHGGVAAGGYRSRGGRGGSGTQGGVGVYGYAANTAAHRGGAHPRVGGGAAASSSGGMATGAPNNTSATGYRVGRGSGSAPNGNHQQNALDGVDMPTHHSNNYYPSSNFNPYAESWHFTGTTGIAQGAQQQQMQSSAYLRGGRPSSQHMNHQQQQQQRGYGAINM